MKNEIHIIVFLFLVCFSFSTANAENSFTSVSQDSIFWEKETIRMQPISFNTLTYEKFRSDPFYNYYESRIKRESIYDRITQYIIQWVQNNLDRTLNKKEVDVALWILGLIFIAVVLFLVYRTNASLFYFNKKNRISYSVEDEDIHGTNFDEWIKNALQNEEYTNAIRWQYLKALKHLDEKKIIFWEPYKTVNEYVYEIKNTALKTQFRELSRNFVYYRYGNGQANEEKFREVQLQSENIIRNS